MYAALYIFPPPPSEQIASIDLPPMPLVNTPAPPPPVEEPPPAFTPNPETPPPPVEPPMMEDEPPSMNDDGQIDERIRRRSEGEFPRPGMFSVGGPNAVDQFNQANKSDAFREARRSIFKDGKEPDWSQFNDAERQMLERIWDRSQRKGSPGGGRRGERMDRPGRGGGAP